MKRILVAVACLLPFALAAEAGINRHSPEDAVSAAYAADEAAIQGRGAGIMGDNTLRARFFSRSLLRSIAAEEVIGGVRIAGYRPRSVQRPGAPSRRPERGPDLGNARRRQGARRVRPRRRRAGAIDLRHAVRTRRMAHRRYRLFHAGWRKPYPARHARGELGKRLRTFVAKLERERRPKSRMRHKA